jgi:hypothetical protein
LVAAKDEALRDLRARAGAIEARLDASGAERRQLSERLTAVLTDRREQKSFYCHSRTTAGRAEPVD